VASLAGHSPSRHRQDNDRICASSYQGMAGLIGDGGGSCAAQHSADDLSAPCALATADLRFDLRSAARSAPLAGVYVSACRADKIRSTTYCDIAAARRMPMFSDHFLAVSGFTSATSAPAPAFCLSPCSHSSASGPSTRSTPQSCLTTFGQRHPACYLRVSETKWFGLTVWWPWLFCAIGGYSSAAWLAAFLSLYSAAWSFF